MQAERAMPGGPEEQLNKAEKKEPKVEGAEDTEAEDTPEERPVSRFEKITGKIKEFWATQFKGEVREKSEEDEFKEALESTSLKVVKAGVPEIASAAASLLGVKSLVDLPRYLSQKYFTNQEKASLMEAFERAGEMPQQEQQEAKVEKDVADAAREKVGSRGAELRAKIEGSKYMTAEKKAELLHRVAEIEAKHAEALGGAEDERKKEFAAAINESIETKVKGTTALKETLNTMAVASGLSAARALVFGGVSLYERYKKVSEQIESGERKGSMFNELVVKGLKETFKELTFREGHTTGEKLKNAAEALASVMRFGGMAAVGLNELNHEGISGAISKAIEGLQAQPVTKFVSGNFSENTHHLMAFLHLESHGDPAGHAGAVAERTSGPAMEHASRAVAGGLLSNETVSAIQEGLHVGETKLEVGTKIHEEVEGLEEGLHGGGHGKE
jgi:hypothetical protein